MKDGIFYWNTDPVILWITESFPLKYYGLFFVIGLLLGYQIVKWIYNKENIPVENLDKLATYIFIGTLLGARLGHVLFYQPDYYFDHPLEIFLPIQEINGSYEFIGFQGLASHGGVLGVFISIIWYSIRYKINLLWILDRIAIAGPVGGAFIRLGNFMNSEIYGKPTNGNWGVVFQRDDLIPRHPTQLYEALSYFIISGILIYTYKKSKNKKFNGILFGVFLILLFLARFIIEFFKENQVAFENQMTLNMGQWLSLPFIIAGVLLLILQRKPSA